MGGGLRSYTVGGRDVLDGYGVDEQPASGRGQVLVPWPNRLQDGSYEFDGRSHQLPLTEPEHVERDPRPRALGGVADRRARGPSRRDGARHPPPARLSVYARARHRVRALGGRPFGATTAPESRRGRVSLRLRAAPVPDARNRHGRHDRAAGAGAAGAASPTSAISRPAPSPSTEPSTTSGPRRTIGATKLDNAFTDLERDDDGRARVRLRDPDGGAAVTLWVDERYCYLMLFTGDTRPDVNRRSLAVEPMTCPPNAFRTGDSLIRLEPGRSTTTAWGIAPS